MDLKNIGRNIRSQREALKITQEKLSEIADCSWRYIQAIEQGKRVPSVKWLNNLSEKINIPLDEFFK